MWDFGRGRLEQERLATKDAVLDLVRFERGRARLCREWPSRPTSCRILLSTKLRRIRSRAAVSFVPRRTPVPTIKGSLLRLLRQKT